MIKASLPHSASTWDDLGNISHAMLSYALHEFRAHNAAARMKFLRILRIK